ncbi:MAG TPA: serine hydrolase [Candidatus Aminicenantes bacterium]|nr:MAG: serine hydrolase [Candidatus Aminicenantes bacterium]HEK86806.1 serine hydrolase [Candidatus Aminicenantes bacterium]
MKASKVCKPILLLVAIFFIFSAGQYLSSQSADLNQKISGHWEGAIELPGMKLEVLVDFKLTAEKKLDGVISIPIQKAKDLPLTDIVITDSEISFAIDGVPGNPVFKGKLDETGQKLSGNFTQSGQTFPFNLTKGEDPVAKAKKILEGMDPTINKALSDLKVPGLALAVVKDKEVIFLKGYGYRDVENKLPMTPDTLLAIGSATKAFTTFSLARLVDEGKLDWDIPVRNYIPWFKFSDPVITERITPRDLVTHRSGLPRHDLLWYNNYQASREELVRRLAYLQFTADLREKFQYNNLMFLTAGYLLETLTGKTWEQAVRELALEPLQMKRTNFSVADSQKDQDFALPYDYRQKKIEKIPFRNITNMGPAGSINSSVREMSNWVIVHLNSGKFGDKQLLNPTTMADLHLPYMPIAQTPPTPYLSPASYALGWFVDYYRGHQRVYHGGNIDGFSALVSMLPNDGFGFVVLTNRNGTGLPELLVRTLSDKLLGLEPVDWIGEAVRNAAQAEQIGEKAEQKVQTRRIKGTKPAHPLEEYAGTYFHPGYGELKITIKDKNLYCTYNGITTPLEHWHYETFNGLQAEDPTFKDMKFTFQTDVNGNVAAVAAPFEPTADDIVFKKKPDERYYDPNFLKKLTGKYILLNQISTIELKGNTLTLYVPGQPIYELVPDLGDEFYLKQVPVIRVRFIFDAKGEVTGLESIQPGGIFELKRYVEGEQKKPEKK